MASSAIGKFVIGISPIGVIDIDGEATVLSQYANSPIILALIDDFVQYIDPTANMQQFFDLVWNVNSAKGYGLDVWGRIVGVNRVLQIAQTDFVGFNEANSWQTFGQAPFFGGGSITANYPLSDDAYRLLILAKAAANIWDGSIPGLNLILRLLFPGQVCYVIDNLDMSMVYTFEFPLTAVQLAVVANSGVLPRPCGVSSTITHF